MTVSRAIPVCFLNCLRALRKWVTDWAVVLTVLPAKNQTDLDHYLTT